MRRRAMVSGSGQRSPRASTIVIIPIVPAPYRLVAVLASGEVERLYAGLSLLVSAAADGAACAGLATFRGLALLLAPDLLSRAGQPEATPDLSWQGRESFARSLLELRETALGLERLELYACAASVEAMGLSAVDVERRLGRVMPMPRFVRAAEGAQLVFV
jgi:peroxiredoxin family protein